MCTKGAWSVLDSIVLISDVHKLINKLKFHAHGSHNWLCLGGWDSGQEIFEENHEGGCTNSSHSNSHARAGDHTSARGSRWSECHPGGSRDENKDVLGFSYYYYRSKDSWVRIGLASWKKYRMYVGYYLGPHAIVKLRPTISWWHPQTHQLQIIVLSIATTIYCCNSIFSGVTIFVFDAIYAICYNDSC
jgi:hypothetical protein